MGRARRLLGWAAALALVLGSAPSEARAARALPGLDRASDRVLFRAESAIHHRAFRGGARSLVQSSCAAVRAADLAGPDDVEALLAAGRIELEHGDRERGLQSLARALAADPSLSVEALGVSDAAALTALAVDAAQDGRVPQAEQLFRRAVALDPRGARAWYGLGTIFAARGQFEAAEGALRTVVELEPDNAGGWEQLGKIHIRLGALYDALADIERALELEPGRAHLRPLLEKLRDATSGEAPPPAAAPSSPGDHRAP